MRPQTIIALVLGVAIGIGVTWFASFRESTTIITESSPPARSRPADTQVKSSLAAAHTSQEITNPAHVVKSRTDLESSESSSNHESPESNRNGLLESDSSVSLNSPTILKRTATEDQIVDPSSDGSYSNYKRIQSLVVRTDYSADNVRLQSVTYQIGVSGILESYEVLGGDRNKLYRASLGYSKRPGPTSGKIVQEQLFDVNQLRYFDDPDESGNPKEKPIYLFVYSYNDDGTPNEPVGINMTKVQEDDSLIDLNGVLHMAVPYGRLPAHIVSALNHSFHIDPLIKP